MIFILALRVRASCVRVVRCILINVSLLGCNVNFFCVVSNAVVLFKLGGRPMFGLAGGRPDEGAAGVGQLAALGFLCPWEGTWFCRAGLGLVV